MRIYVSFIAVLALVGFSACNQPVSTSSLEQQVNSAMAGLPYQYRLLSKLDSKEYVTFVVLNPRQKLGVTFAYGLPGKGGDCPPVPELPPHRKGAKPDVAAGPEPLICLADDSWRRGDNYRESIIRGRMSSDVATALCHEVYDQLRCFI